MKTGTLLIKKFKTQNNDNVNSPKHYTAHPSGIEAIQICEHYNFCIGNAIKYLWRSGLKSSDSLSAKESEIQDLKKQLGILTDKFKT